jgi:hypothetical protein
MGWPGAAHLRSPTLTTSPSPVATDALHLIEEALAHGGFARLEGAQTLDLLGANAAAGWADFARSWDDLGSDGYMADGGRYRRRRHAVFLCTDGAFTRKPHQPHYQSRDYNPLNGDVQRWFEPVLPATMDNPVIQAIFDFCLSVIATVDPTAPGTAWHSEMHQFRIETTPDHVGRPTPEGLHRDGVDWVFVMLICRNNVRDGITEIGAPDGTDLGRFLLQNPGDAVLLDDRRILHGVTEIHAVDPEAPAYRDVLVVTFARP